MRWGKFAAMIAVSTIVMFGLMYLNTYQIDHVFFSQTRMWMALYMGAAMAAIMLAVMWKMYPGQGAKIAVMIGSAAAFSVGLGLVRSQATVGDEAWMKAMIPHHSIAVLTSSRAHIKDPRVRELADGIIEAQVREIEEMKLLLRDIEANGVRGADADLPARPTTLSPQMEAAAQARLR
ncbi:MAG: DUF305 domain-containing protein [Sphingomicrobium sp.]